MLKKRYIKRAYIEEAICDKCGSLMEHNGIVLTTYPEKYSYCCTNPDCDGCISFFSYERPGIVRYEFEDDIEDLLITDNIETIKELSSFIHTIDPAIIGGGIKYV